MTVVKMINHIYTIKNLIFLIVFGSCFFTFFASLSVNFIIKTILIVIIAQLVFYISRFFLIPVIWYYGSKTNFPFVLKMCCSKTGLGIKSNPSFDSSFNLNNFIKTENTTLIFNKKNDSFFNRNESNEKIVEFTSESIIYQNKIIKWLDIKSWGYELDVKRGYQSSTETINIHLDNGETLELTSREIYQKKYFELLVIMIIYSCHFKIQI